MEIVAVGKGNCIKGSMSLSLGPLQCLVQVETLGEFGLFFVLLSVGLRLSISSIKGVGALHWLFVFYTFLRLYLFCFHTALCLVVSKLSE